MKMQIPAGIARLASLRSSFGSCFRSVTLLAATLSLGVGSLSAVPLVPGVYGFGVEKSSSTGYSGNSAGFGTNSDIIEVTNTNDTGTGSLRAALAVSTSSPRIIVFKTSGVITLQTDLNLNYGNRTIAGQTAPYPGITIRGASLVVKAGNVLVQHLRFRPGDDWNDDVPTHNRDSVRIEHTTNTISNVVFDHCTFSWSTDEAVSAWYDWDGITFNRCLFAEPLELSIHIDENQFPGNLPMQAESFPNAGLGRSITDSGSDVTVTAQHSSEAPGSGNNYHLITGNSNGDWAEYTFEVESRSGNRTGNFPLVTGITGNNQARFRVKVYDDEGDLVYTSQLFDPNRAAERVNFIGDDSPDGDPSFTIPGVGSDLEPESLTYRVRIQLEGQTGTNWQVGIDQIAFVQRHGMGPIIGWGDDGGKISFTNSVIAHIRERGPWAYPLQLFFANNVLYNRSSRFLMLGHGAESPHGIATTKAEIVGNMIIEGRSRPNPNLTPPFRNEGLASSARFHLADTEWDDGNYSGASVRLFGPESGSNVIPVDYTTDSRYSATTPFTLTEGLAGFTAVSPDAAFNKALIDVGARPAERDSAERRVLTDLAQSICYQDLSQRPGTKVNSVAEAGGWPSSWFQNNTATWTAPASGVRNTDPDGNGYTVVEEWLQGLAAQVEGVVPEATAYSEAFGGTAPALDWTPVAGTWAESGGTYNQSANITAAISVYDGGTWATDYTVSARLFNDWTGTGNRVGLVYNYVNSSNYSYVTFNTSGEVEVSRVTGGGSPVVIASGLYEGGGDAVWFEAAVRRRGNMTAILVNGRPCLPNVWEENLGAGKAGLFTRSNQTGKFDDFQVVSTSGGGTAFNDFENLSTAGWTVTGDGTWQVPLDGSTRVWHQTLDTATDPFATLDNSHSSDHSIMADVKHVGFGTSGWYGVFARYSDANNYYYVKISGSTAEIKKMSGGSFSTLDSVSYTPSTSEYRTLQFVVEGAGSTSLNLYIDGVLKCSYTDSSPLPAGKAGLLAYHAEVKYDNVSVSPVAGGTVLVADDFAGGDGNWNELSGSWAVSSGWYRQSATTNTDSRTHRGGAMTNQSVEVDARALQNPLPTNKWFGVLARFNDANNYYYLILRQNNVVELKKIVGGSFSLLDDASFTVAPNTTYTLKLEVIGTALRGYVNGQLLVRANDTSLSSGTNGAALMTSGLSAEFDDVLITAP